MQIRSLTPPVAGRFSPQVTVVMRQGSFGCGCRVEKGATLYLRPIKLWQHDLNPSARQETRNSKPVANFLPGFKTTEPQGLMEQKSV